VLGYVRETGQVTPEILLRAEQLVGIGYQRLLAFQRPDGGFDWWGKEPGLTFLTAYAIQEFHDLGKVHEIDGSILEKARNFLFQVQEKDGSWVRAGASHGVRIEHLPPVALTAYCAWSILETGYRDGRTEKALAYLREHLDQAEGDDYTLALVANALVAGDRESQLTASVLDKLAARARPEGNTVFWAVKGKTMYYGSGRSGDVEATALAAHAMIRARRHPELANRALAFLVQARNGSGAWGSTQATILALKAILQASASQGEMKSNAEITVELNGEKKHVIVTPETWDVLQILDFKDSTRKGENRVRISYGGEVNLSYQLVGRHFIPWSQLPREAVRKPIELSVDYDRRDLSREDVIRATARMRYNCPEPTYMVIVTLGLPPGFVVDRGDFAEMVGMKKIKKFDLNPRQATLYIGDVKPGQAFEFIYHLMPKYPIKARTARSAAYEYYNPDRRAVVEPVEIVVR